MRSVLISLACAGLAVSACDARAPAGGAASAPGAQAVTEGGGRLPLFKAPTSEAEKAIRAAIRDENGIVPYDFLVDDGTFDRLQTWAEADPSGVFAYYKELRASGLCVKGYRDIGDIHTWPDGRRSVVLRAPDAVCRRFLAAAVKKGDPDANFEAGLDDIRSAKVDPYSPADVNRRDMERSLELARKHFTIAQQSKTPEVADKARKVLAEFETLQISRGYGGAESDQLRAVFLGAMAVAAVQEAGKLGEAAERDCNARKAGAMASLSAMPNC